MTPIEKAKELVEKFIKKLYYITDGDEDYGKECALIAVDEILSVVKGGVEICNSPACKYWQQIKEEIEKL